MTNWTTQRMEAERVVRYADLIPCLNAFIDTRNPGSEAKENFTIIGPGVSENPDQHVHIAEPHGFNIGGARQPPGCINSQHSHDTAEVFVVHSGNWRFTLGEEGRDAHVDCAPGDVISLPTGMFRGFTCLPRHEGDTDPAYLFAVLGGDDPGRVLWAPYVFDMAEKFGLVLMEDGSLVDTVKGQAVPEGARPMPRTTAEQIAALHVPTSEEAKALVYRHAEGPGDIIANGGTFKREHGFGLRRHDLERNTDRDCEAQDHAHVWFVHQGKARMEWDQGGLSLDAGDVITVPPGLSCRFVADQNTTLFQVWR
ncbi:AraC-like ligand binding domain-containing protein [Parasphingorhabdus marina DSM 22363]|uniref:AraC-like ligand binding domain-containing protein n=1 Tax=Parasphingorhabdus marina DSM 22363 TaxID=1123272 RepID=A0A1N6D396_9SPHN|nr:AraC family ligand binding domain-containing protein [Parasphingorhabdus marina]SIN65302.1 AraC-like ligand binding domain-containing protein [Parasphingorhabdus marina DSM 22363]